MNVPNVKTHSNSNLKVNFTFKPIKYNQYVQTHMSWQDQTKLVHQQENQIPIRIIPPKINQSKTQSRIKQLKNSKVIKMPIPQFEIDHMQYSQIDDSQSLKHSLGVQKQNSFLISSQLTSLPLKYQTASIQTQTDDFTFFQNLFSEPKIYEIPVQVQVQEYPDCSQKEVQVNESLFEQLIQKLQQNNSAVRRQRLEMNSGTISLSIDNFSFSKFDRLEQIRKQDNNQSSNDNNSQNQPFQDQEEMLLQISPQTDNKQKMYNTGNFETTLVNNQFYTPNTPQKSRISGSQSSPDTDGPMQISQRQVNMMTTKNIASATIDQQQYQDLQSRFYILQQQNTQKLDQIQKLSKKIGQLTKELQKYKVIQAQNQSYQKRYKKLQKQINQKQIQLEQIKSNTLQLQYQIKKLQQQNQQKQLEIQDIFTTKQKEIEELQKEIFVYRQQINSGEEKLSKQNQNLENIISQKQIQINDLKTQFQRKYQLYIISIEEMKQKIEKYEITLEKMEAVVNSKDLKTNQLKQENSKMRDQISILCKRIQAMKEQINKSSSSQMSSSQCRQRRQSNSTMIVSNSNSHQYQSMTNNAMNKVKSASRNKVQNSKPSTTSIITNSSSNVSNFPNSQQPLNNINRMQYNSSNIIVEQQRQSDHKINHQNQNQSSHNHSNKSNTNSQYDAMRQQQGKIFIQQSHQPSKFINYSFQKFNSIYPSSSEHFSYRQYIQQLQKIILIYENLIVKNTETIQELEEKVLEFLKDALTKQSQAQLLYSQLCQYQNNMNGLLVEKVDMELQNQRLKKMIVDSENKLSILGNRLIKLAKNNSFSINNSKNQKDQINSSHSLDQQIINR